MGANGPGAAVPDDVTGIALIPFPEHDLAGVEPARDSHFDDVLEVLLGEVREDRNSPEEVGDLIAGGGHGRGLNNAPR